MWRKGIFAYMKPFTKVAVSCIVMALAFLSACIDRDNPFDPINLPRIQPDKIREANASYLDNLKARAEGIRSLLQAMRAGLVADTTALRNTESKADSVRAANVLQRQENQARRAANATQTDGSLLLDLSELDFLPLFSPQATFDDLGPLNNELTVIKSNARDRIDSVNRVYFPELIFSDSWRQATLAAFDLALDDAGGLAADTARWSGRRIPAMLGMQIENDSLAAENRAIQNYNDSIAFHRNRGSRPIISTPESLTVAIKRLKVGDSIFLDRGTYSGQITIPQISGTAQSPILIQGIPGGGTILTSADTGDTFVISTGKNIIIKDITFAKGKKSGVKLIGQTDSVIFERCEFRDNAVHGLEIATASVLIRHCRFIGNRGDGIRIQTSQGNNVGLLNVLVVQNGGRGIYGTDLRSWVSGSTVADNAQGGIHLDGSIGELILQTSIVAFNRSYGLSLNSQALQTGPLGIFRSDFFENDGVDFAQQLPSSPLIDTLSVEPGFISRDTSTGFNYNLREESALRAFEKAGVVIGWREL
jgi:Right handed beta helix region